MARQFRMAFFELRLVERKADDGAVAAALR